MTDRRVGARQGRLGEGRGDERAEQMGGALAKSALGEIADDDGALVHQAAEGDGAFRLGQHVAQARHHQRLADLVLDGGDGLAAEMLRPGLVFVDPEGAHHRVADMVADKPNPEGLVDEQAGEHEQGGAGNIEQSADGVGEDVIEPRSPAVRPDMAKGRDDAIGDDRLEMIGNTGRGD